MMYITSWGKLWSFVPLYLWMDYERGGPNDRVHLSICLLRCTRSYCSRIKTQRWSSQWGIWMSCATSLSSHLREFWLKAHTHTRHQQQQLFTVNKGCHNSQQRQLARCLKCQTRWGKSRLWLLVKLNYKEHSNQDRRQIENWNASPLVVAWRGKVQNS